MNLELLLTGIVAIAIGIAMLIWREQFVQRVAASQKRVWHYEYGPREFRSARVVAVIVGAGFVIVGILRVKSGVGL